jgi:hypothetical protein
MVFEEVFLGIPQDPFDFSFLPRRSHLTDFGNKPQLAGKVEKEQIEADQGTIPLSHDTLHVVEQDFPGQALESVEGMQMTTAQGGQSHRVGEFQVEQTAVRFDQAKGVEPASGAAIIDLATIGPIHLELLPGRQFDADKSLNGPAGPNLAQIGVENAVATLIAQGAQPLEQPLAAQLGILGQPLLNLGAEKVQFAFPLAFFPFDHRSLGVLLDRLAVQSQLLGDFADTALFHLGQLVDRMDLFRGYNHQETSRC